MKKDSDEILAMIWDMLKTDLEYFKKPNKASIQCDRIQTHVLGLETDLHFGNKERKQAITIFQHPIK